MAEIAEAIEKSPELGKEQTERVSPFDIDFLCFALPFAIIVDVIDIVLEITSILVIPKVLGMAMDVVTFAIIGGWIYWRTGNIIKSREKQKEALQKKMGQQATKMQQQLVKGAAKGPLRKTLTRAGVAVIGEIIPFVGLIPFWTISVLLTLREEGK